MLCVIRDVGLLSSWPAAAAWESRRGRAWVLGRPAGQGGIMRRRLTEVPGSGPPRRPESSREQTAAGPPGAVARRWRRTAPDEQVRMLTVLGRVLRVAVRGGNPHWPPLVLCN